MRRRRARAPQHRRHGHPVDYESHLCMWHATHHRGSGFRVQCNGGGPARQQTTISLSERVPPRAQRAAGATGGWRASWTRPGWPPAGVDWGGRVQEVAVGSPREQCGCAAGGKWLPVAAHPTHTHTRLDAGNSHGDAAQHHERQQPDDHGQRGQGIRNVGPVLTAHACARVRPPKTHTTVKAV